MSKTRRQIDRKYLKIGKYEKSKKGKISEHKYKQKKLKTKRESRKGRKNKRKKTLIMVRPMLGSARWQVSAITGYMQDITGYMRDIAPAVERESPLAS
jgi:hypothetical protein